MSLSDYSMFAVTAAVPADLEDVLLRPPTFYRATTADEHHIFDVPPEHADSGAGETLDYPFGCNMITTYEYHPNGRQPGWTTTPVIDLESADWTSTYGAAQSGTGTVHCYAYVSFTNSSAAPAYQSQDNYYPPPDDGSLYLGPWGYDPLYQDIAVAFVCFVDGVGRVTLDNEDETFTIRTHEEGYYWKPDAGNVNLYNGDGTPSVTFVESHIYDPTDPIPVQVSSTPTMLGRSDQVGRWNVEFIRDPDGDITAVPGRIDGVTRDFSAPIAEEVRIQPRTIGMVIVYTFIAVPGEPEVIVDGQARQGHYGNLDQGYALYWVFKSLDLLRGGDVIASWRPDFDPQRDPGHIVKDIARPQIVLVDWSFQEATDS